MQAPQGQGNIEGNPTVGLTKWAVGLGQEKMQPHLSHRKMNSCRGNRSTGCMVSFDLSWNQESLYCVFFNKVGTDKKCLSGTTDLWMHLLVQNR